MFHPNAGLTVRDAVACGVAATVPYVDQRLTNPMQIRLGLRMLIEEGLHVRLNLVTRDSLETGEEPVHVRMR